MIKKWRILRKVVKALKLDKTTNLLKFEYCTQFEILQDNNKKDVNTNEGRFIKNKYNQYKFKEDSRNIVEIHL